MKKLNGMSVEELKDTCREYGVPTSGKNKNELIMSLAKNLELNHIEVEYDPVEVPKKEASEEKASTPKKKRVKYIGTIPAEWDKKKTNAWKKHYREFFAEGGETEDEVMTEMNLWSTEYDEAVAEKSVSPRSKLIEFNDKSQSLGAWAKELGIGYGTIRDRIYKMHWPIEKALSTNVTRGKSGEMYEFNGECQSLSEWSEELGIGYGTLYDRIHKMKWPVEKAFSTPTRREKKDDVDVESAETEE